MFKKAGKKTSKVLAYLLALMVVVGYVPAEIILSAVAADEATLDYNFIVTNGLADEDLVEYEGATIVIKNGEEQVGEALTTDENGQAIAVGLEDATEYSYTVTLLGYEDATGSFTTDSATDPKEVNVTMTALQEATITGTVTDGTDAYEGATVTLSGYSEDSVITDENGEYTLSGYVGKAYTVTVTPKAEDEAKFNKPEKEFIPDSADYALTTIDLSIATYIVSVADGVSKGTVSFYEDENATQEIADLNSIPYGTEVTVKVEADEDYRIKTDSFSVTGDGIANAELDSDNKFTFTVKSDVAVSVEFEQYLFAVNDSVTGEDHGTVSFDGLTNTGKAEKDSTVKISVSADQGYCIESMEVNGTSIDNIDGKKIEEYTIDSVENDIEVVVKYRVKTYKITFTVDNNGNVKYNDVDADIIIGGSIDVEKIFNESEDLDNPTKVTVTATPNTGYRVEMVKIDATTSEFDENNKTHEHTFTMDTNHTYAVTFAKNLYTVTVPSADSIPDCKSISVDKTLVEHGESVKLTVNVKKPDKKKLKSVELTTGSGVIGEFIAKDKVRDYQPYEIEITNITSNIEIKAVIDNKEQLLGGWNNYVSIEPEQNTGRLISNVTDSDGNNVLTYSSGTKLQMVPIGYDKVDYLEKDATAYVGMTAKHIISKSTTIEVLQVLKNNILSEDEEFGVSLNEKKLIIIIDNTDPVLTLDPSITNNKILTNTDSVTISCAVTDEDTEINPSSGIDRVVYTTEANLTEAEVLALTTTATLSDGKYSFETTGEQNNTYYIYAIDIAGNVSEAKLVNVVIDKTAPTLGEPTKSPNVDYTNGDVTISIEANDVNGIAKVVYTTENLDNNATAVKALETTATFDSQENKYTFTLTEEVNTTYFIYAIDNAGNVSAQKPINVCITRAVPALGDPSKDPSGEWTNNENVTISGIANGSVAPVVKVVYSISDTYDEQNTQDATFSNGQYQFTVSGEQNKTYYIYAIDSAGNVSAPKAVDVKIDMTKPAIDSFEFEPDNSDPISRAINFLSFGMFFNETIKVKANVFDGDEEIDSQCKEIVFKLYSDAAATTPLKTYDPVGVGESITIDADFKGVVKAIVYDNAGNDSVETLATSANSSNSGLIMVEDNEPVIKFNTVTPAANDKNWYNKKDISIPFTVEDIDGEQINSGIYSISVEAFYNNFEKSYATKTFNSELGINEKLKNEITIDMTLGTDSTDTFAYKGDGKYKLVVTVCDNAGNEVTDEKELSVDTTVAQITKFDLGKASENVQEIGDYGFYFQNDTTINVFLSDVVDGVKDVSGVKELRYYTVDYTNPSSPKQSEDASAKITYKDDVPVAEIPIKAGFKGQVYVWVIDNAGNDSTKDYNGNNVAPVKPNGSIIESQEQHNAAAEAHVAFSVPETTVKTASGSPLYKATVPVSIVVTDTFAGIRKIEWSVTSAYDTTNNQTGSIELANVINTAKGGVYEGWKVDEKENNLVTVMSKTIDVANNSNDIVVKVTMTDRAGNTTTDDISFSIDKTAPVIEVAYDNNTPDAEYDSFYKANRTATITVTERNFNPDDVKLVIENTDNVIPKLSNWTKTAVEDGIHPDGTVYTAKIDYVADGDYTFDIDYSDRATNAAEYVVGVGSDGGNVTNDDFVKHEFTIDKTNPVVKVTYDNNKALNKNYYDAERTATITVTEHNFDASRIVVTGEATDNGKKIQFPAITGWSSKGDVHTTTINYKADAEYTFDIKVTDKADNVDDSYKVETFFVDKTAPEVEITGVANNSANNGKVAPVVNYTDTNFTEDGVTVTLTGVNRGRVDYSRGVANVANGQTMSYENFRNVKEVDDIYTLTAKVVDKAGNETTKSITFSVNRFGSTYNLEAVKSYNNKYIQSMGDLVFTEVNVNSLDLGNIRVKLTKNGTPSDLVMNQDFTVDVAGGGGRWYTYTYTIKSALFQDDAKYSLSFYSVDASGNVNENIDETKEAVVSFAVDKTKPVIIPIDLAEGERYKETVKNVTIEVKDNLLLEDVKIYLNDSEVEYTVEGESYTIQVPESPERQIIKVVAVDAAGNEYETVVKDFLVSTNVFVQFVNNTPVFIGSIVALVVVIGAIIAFIIFGKKKRRK